MVGLLGFINEKLTEAGIPYEFGEWTTDVSYPYFVGSYTETDYSYEDNHATGAFTLDGWSRGSKIELVEHSDKVKAVFTDLFEVRGDSTFFIRYGGAMLVPTGEKDLYKITITLFCNEWKGE